MNTSGKAHEATGHSTARGKTRASTDRRGRHYQWAVSARHVAPVAATERSADAEACYVLGYN